MGKETTLVALYLCALVSVALSVSGNYKEENEGWSTSAVFTSRNLLDTDDDDDQPPATPQPKKVLSSNTPSVEEIKKLSDSRLRKKLFLLGLPYKNLTVPELRESLTKALYPELAAKQLLEKLEKQKQLEAAEAARQLATKLAEGMIRSRTQCVVTLFQKHERKRNKRKKKRHNGSRSKDYWMKRDRENSSRWRKNTTSRKKPSLPNKRQGKSRRGM